MRHYLLEIELLGLGTRCGLTVYAASAAEARTYACRVYALDGVAIRILSCEPTDLGI